MSALVESIRDLAAPVVMISANGLICLALYNRLAAITTRMRLFHRERFEVHQSLLQQTLNGETPRESGPHILRLESLERQCMLIRRRARLLRDALLFLLLGVVFMLSSSLAIGLSQFLARLALAGAAIFVLGVFAMSAGVALAMRELWVALEVVDEEMEMFHRLSACDDDENLSSLEASLAKEFRGLPWGQLADAAADRSHRAKSQDDRASIAS